MRVVLHTIHKYLHAAKLIVTANIVYVLAGTVRTLLMPIQIGVCLRAYYAKHLRPVNMRMSAFARLAHYDTFTAATRTEPAAPTQPIH